MAPKPCCAPPALTVASSPRPASPSPPSPAGDHLARLPAELLLCVLSRVTIRSLTKGLARASHHWARIVDEHLRREVYRLIGGESPPGDCTLAFQQLDSHACRRFRLYFSHFRVANSTGGACSTTAIFSFLPEEVGDETRLISPSRPRSKDEDGGDGAHQGESSSAVPTDLVGRVRPEHGTSSALPEQSSSTSRGSTIQTFRAMRAASPTTPARSDAHDCNPRASASVRTTYTSRWHSRRKPVTKPTYRRIFEAEHSFSAFLCRLNVQVTSSAPFIESKVFHQNRSGRLISSDRGFSSSAGNLTRAITWDKELMRGSGRVYPDWFHCPEAEEIPTPGKGKGNHPDGGDVEAATPSVTPEIISRYGSMGEALESVHRDMLSKYQNICSEDEQSDDDDPVLPSLPSRVTEIDDASCLLHLQPRSFQLHPLLVWFRNLTTFHSLDCTSPIFGGEYFSLINSLAYHRRERRTWHAEGVEINAARLLSFLEVVELERLSWERRSDVQIKQSPAPTEGELSPKKRKADEVEQSRAALVGTGDIIEGMLTHVKTLQRSDFVLGEEGEVRISDYRWHCCDT